MEQYEVLNMKSLCKILCRFGEKGPMLIESCSKLIISKHKLSQIIKNIL